ncbi:hypothetical protein J8F10_31870 [Gemmata sp. G18]|uniref:Uncharacterized protein n=1 Tax=Gemmata palustris TaxID=2822762 RepID=A0ABS5C317_9BACT|nr:hypothetical protein [Gemmata palustris]MBP3959870.1 hypothetical protein [Gemmata palustris]
MRAPALTTIATTIGVYESLVADLARGAEINVQLMLTVLAAAGKSVLELEQDVIAADRAGAENAMPSAGKEDS